MIIWMNEMNKLMNEWTNDGIKELINDWKNEWINE